MNGKAGGAVVARRLIIAVAMLLTLALPASASALPFLSAGRARHALELRFERNEERFGSGPEELLNCYRVTSTHVNCYADAHESAYRCEVNLWRVYETANAQEQARGKYTLNTRGSRWSDSCQSEE